MASINGILKGATLGTVLGSLALYLYPRRREIIEAMIDQASEFTDRARDYADDFLGESQHTGVNGYLTSGIAGALLGAGIILALSPKTGRQFRSKLSNVYKILSNQTQDLAHVFTHNGHPRRRRHPSTRLHRKRAHRRLIRAK